MSELALKAYTLTSALGRGRAAHLQALQNEQSGLSACDFETVDLPAWIGRVDGLEDEPLADELAGFDCRNNRLAAAGLVQDGFAQTVADLRDRLGVSRIGVFLGTSTSGIHRTERAYRDLEANGGLLPEDYVYSHTHNTYSVARFVRHQLGLTGPAMVISTACSSGARAFASASRYIAAGWCDAAIVGGVDSLCLTTLYGFSSLQLVSTQPCRPADANRDGISIGEAAAFALVMPASEADNDIQVLSYGESSDAYHMSSPEPEGAGARLAMQRALDNAGLPASSVDYINLHGTATPANDAAEDKAVTALLGADTACSSTKGWTGHTLGAAGGIEALICAMAIEEGFKPRSLNTESLDPALQARILQQSESTEVRYAMSNSFGFGGNNCSLLLGRRA